MLDTALALQLRRRGRVDRSPARASSPPRWPSGRASTRDTLCVGRTHGVHAEPTTFGLKLAGFAFEAHRNAERLERAFAQAAIGAISGAVGTYASLGPDYEARVLERLGLRAEPVSTQVVPRDRHAELLQAIALAGAGLERFATEIRHLQRTEVREVEEPFRAGQKGSSAMPHKRNPITTERITGLARVLRGYAQAGLENVALWHERDISHSGAERVILPDATILLDYMQHLALRVVRGMTVHADRMRAQPRAHLRRAVLPARAARARRGRDAARRRLPDRPAARPAGVGHADAAARRCSPRAAASALDLDAVFDYGALHAPRARGAGAAGGDPGAGMSESLLLRRAPGSSADLFHAIPPGSSTRSSTSSATTAASRSISVLDAPTRSLGARASRSLDPSTLGRDELLDAGRRLPRAPSSRPPCARAASSALERAIVPPDFPLASPTTCARAGIELRVDAEALRPAPAASRRDAQLEGIRRAQEAADAAMGVAARADPRAARRARRPRRCARRCRRSCDEHGCELPDDVIVAHGAQRRVGHEAGYGADRARRAGGRRHLAARPRLALLGGHDAHVRRRRRRAAGGARGVLAS